MWTRRFVFLVLVGCKLASLGSLRNFQRRNERLAEWRYKMKQKGKYCTRWLKESCCPAPTSVIKADGQCTASVSETFVAIKDFWSRVWDRDLECEELQRLRDGTLTRGPQQTPFEWVLTPEELRAAAASKSGGAAGVDGWSGDEISDWPTRAWSIFLQLWERWADRGEFPAVWRELRQIFFKKRLTLMQRDRRSCGLLLLKAFFAEFWLPRW